MPLPALQRGGGYTDPRPDYDGGGGGTFGTWLGQVPPIDDEFDTLVNPGVDGPTTTGRGRRPGNWQWSPVDPRVVNPVPDDFAEGWTGNRSAASLHQAGGEAFTDSGVIAYDSSHAMLPERVHPSVSGDQKMVKLQGNYARDLSGAAESKGLFALYRTYSCSGNRISLKGFPARERGDRAAARRALRNLARRELRSRRTRRG
jgi:hypothetical protein